jgi:hypothetical protein
MDNYFVYLSEKNGADYFPKGKDSDSKGERIYFNIVYRDPYNPIKPKNKKTPPDD